MLTYDITEFVAYEDGDARVVHIDPESTPCLLNGTYSIRSHINLDRSNRRCFTSNAIPDADRVPQIIHQAVHFDIGTYVTLHSSTLLLLTYEAFMAHIKETFLPTNWEFEYAYRLTKRQDELDFLEWVSIIKATNFCLAGTVHHKTEAQLLIWFKSAMSRPLWAAYEGTDNFKTLHSSTDLIQWVHRVSAIADDCDYSMRVTAKPSRSSSVANAMPNTPFPGCVHPGRIPSGPSHSVSTRSGIPPCAKPLESLPRTTSLAPPPCAPLISGSTFARSVPPSSASTLSSSRPYTTLSEIYDSLPPHVPRPPPLTKPWHDYLLKNKGCYKCRGIFVDHLSSECDMEKNINRCNWSRMLSADECAPLLKAWRDRRQLLPRVAGPGPLATEIVTPSMEEHLKA